MRRPARPGSELKRRRKWRGYPSEGADWLLALCVRETGEEYEITKRANASSCSVAGRGLGNALFKSSTSNQNPFEQAVGKGGKGGDELTLKIIADAGFWVC